MNLYELIKKNNFQGFSLALIRRWVILICVQQNDFMIDDMLCMILLFHVIFAVISRFLHFMLYISWIALHISPSV